MSETETIELPMNEQQWEKSGIHQQGASLFTTISLAQGEILNFMEGKGQVTMTDIVSQLELPPPIVMMAIGGLIKEVLIAAKRHNQFVSLNKNMPLDKELLYAKDKDYRDTGE